MAEVRGNQPQVPLDEIRAAPGAADMAAFQQGLAAGREWARKASQRTLAWIEENPGQALLIALGAGFIAGQLLFRRRTLADELAE